MKKVLFIGNRCAVWDQLRREDGLSLALTIAVHDSFLARHPELARTPHLVVRKKTELLAAVESCPFDVLVSNGCPFILPIARWRKPGRLFLNVHPSLLPHLRGPHPVNGALLLGHAQTGATLHHMDEGADTGRIIAQREIPITPDLDLALLYVCLFHLEGQVFADGIARLRTHAFDFPGELQTGTGSTYARATADFTVDLAKIERAEFLRRVRAFGIPSQGVRCDIGGEPVVVYEAEAIDNPVVADLAGPGPNGSVALATGGHRIIRCAGGLVKIKGWRPLSSS